MTKKMDLLNLLETIKDNAEWMIECIEDEDYLEIDMCLELTEYRAHQAREVVKDAINESEGR